MTSPELENLVRIGKLKREPPSRPEFDGLLLSGRTRLADAANGSLALQSRFDLAYNAAHALALAALRRLGYRSDNRYLVFQRFPTLSVFPQQHGESWPRVTRSETNSNMAACWTLTTGCFPT